LPIITVTSSWRGVGKSTIATHLAHGFAHAGLDTLLVDRGSAPSSSSLLGFVTDDGNIWSPPARARHDQFVRQIRKRLDLVPTVATQRALPAGRILEARAATSGKLEDLISLSGDPYEIVVIDQDSEGDSFSTAILNSDIVVVPVSENPNSVESLKDLLEKTATMKAMPHWAIVRSGAGQSVGLAELLILDRVKMIIEHHLINRAAKEHRLIPRPHVCLLSSVIRHSNLIPELAECHLTAFDFGDRKLSIDLLAQDSREKFLELRTKYELMKPIRPDLDYAQLTEELLAFMACIKVSSPVSMSALRSSPLRQMN